jgi:hypothetical protein
MGKHEAPETPETPEPKRSTRHRIADAALHPVVHIITLVSLHSAALLLIDKTPLLTLLFLH